MSTTIYTAWKFRQNKLNEFLQLARKSIFKREVKYWTNAMYGVSINGEVDNKLKEMDYPRLKTKPDILRKMAAFLIVNRKYEEGIKEADSDPSKKVLLKETGLRLWLYKGYYYCIPYGEYTDNIFDKVKIPNWVSDYSYWNNTDQPKDVSDREWEGRRKTWDDVCLRHAEQWTELRLNHEIFSCRDFMSFFYYMLEMEKALGLRKYFLM